MTKGVGEMIMHNGFLLLAARDPTVVMLESVDEVFTPASIDMCASLRLEMCAHCIFLTSTRIARP